LEELVGVRTVWPSGPPAPDAQPRRSLAIGLVGRGLPCPHVPIIVLTAARDAGQRAAEINAEGFLGKPFDLNELLVLVAQYVSAQV
jgi:CheY-like chemotaxis protein